MKRHERFERRSSSYRTVLLRIDTLISCHSLSHPLVPRWSDEYIFLSLSHERCPTLRRRTGFTLISLKRHRSATVLPRPTLGFPVYRPGFQQILLLRWNPYFLLRAGYGDFVLSILFGPVHYESSRGIRISWGNFGKQELRKTHLFSFLGSFGKLISGVSLRFWSDVSFVRRFAEFCLSRVCRVVWKGRAAFCKPYIFKLI